MIEISTENYKKYSSLFTIAIILLPILNSFEYPIKKIGFGEFIIILIMIFGTKDIYRHYISSYISTKSSKSIKDILKDHWPYMLFLVYSVLITGIAFFFTPSFSLVEVFGRLSRQLLYGFILIVFVPKYFNPKRAFKIYEISVIIAVIYLLVQVVLNKIGYSFYPNFIPADLLYTIQDSTEYRYHFNLLILQNFRPTSFFLEPAYYVEYTVPFVAISLFSGKRSIKHLLVIFIVTLTVFITKSANGIVFIGVVYLLYFSYTIYKSKLKNKYLYTVFFLLIFANIFALLYYMDNSYVLSLMARFREVGIGKGNTSGNIRILRGFLVFFALSGVYRIFGFGFGNYLQFKDDYGIYTEMDHYVNNTDYMSGFTQILTSGGIVGISLFLFALYSYSKKAGPIGYVLGCLLTVMMITSSFYATPVYLLILAFIISYGQVQKKETKGV